MRSWLAADAREGRPPHRYTAGDFGLKVLPFDAKAAAIAGTLIAKAQPLNIGFGDCACIATGMARGATIYTADRDWLKLGSDADIRLIR